MTVSKADKTKQYIIEKIAPVFNEKGYAGTSLSDIEKATGLTKGSIYGNFENKDEIAVAAFKHNISLIASHLKSCIEAEESVIDKLLVFPQTYRNYFKLPFLYGGCPILNTSTEADDTHPELRNEAKAAILSWKNSVELLVKKGVRTGELKKDVDAKEFATVMIALIEGSVMVAKLNGNVTALNTSMNYLKKIIMQLKK
jgi:AcrR family transcriptional regulator